MVVQYWETRPMKRVIMLDAALTTALTLSLTKETTWPMVGEFLCRG